MAFLFDERGDFGLGVVYPPAEEIDGLLVVLIENLTDDGLIVRIADGGRGGTDPFLCLVLDAEIGEIGIGLAIGYGAEVGVRLVFPAVLKLFGDAATALGEAGIADVIVVHEDLSVGGLDGFLYFGLGGAGDALIALAMVVGTDIEELVVFAVVPADNLGIGGDHLAGCGELFLVEVLAFLDLGEEPATRDDGVRLEELDGRVGVHLGGDDADEVFLDGEDIDGGDLVVVDDEFEDAAEALGFLAFPMEMDADGDVFEREAGFIVNGGEDEFGVRVAVPLDVLLVEGDLLGAVDGLSLTEVGGVQRDAHLAGADDTYAHFWLFHISWFLFVVLFYTVCFTLFLFHTVFYLTQNTGEDIRMEPCLFLPDHVFNKRNRSCHNSNNASHYL